MKILVVDDDALIRDGLKTLLELESDFTVCGTASNGQEAVEICKIEHPELVLMDIRMPVMDGVLSTKQIKHHCPETKVVILTTFKDDDYVREAIANGAEGYILKSQSFASIVESLRVVCQGNTVYERQVSDILHSILKGERKKDPSEYGLSIREFDVLRLVGEGCSNEEIGEKLYLSSGTVRNYVSLLLEKLALRDRTQLAIFYNKHF